MADNPPAPMSWQEYEIRLRESWNTLLNSKPSESDVQSFLEKHPCLIPGHSSMSMTSGHYPFPHAVISQPRIQGIEAKQPDFMWLSTNSLELEPILIEIERPDKRWFNKSGDPSGDFVQAQSQLAQWKAWFNHPENQLVFLRNYDLPQMLSKRKLKPSFVLIYGRRSEYENNESLNRVRAELPRDNEYLMSYDRLTPSADAQYLFTVKRDTTRYRAIAYPPTYILGPNFADKYTVVNEKNNAIDLCEWMTQERKEFVKSRFPYWESWAKQDSKGIIHGGDSE